MKKMEIHAGVIDKGTIAHSPHVHGEEEILIVLGNEFEEIHLNSDGTAYESERLLAGMFIYYPVGMGTNHSVRNPTLEGTSFLLFKYVSHRKQDTVAAMKGGVRPEIQTFSFGHLGDKRHQKLLSFPTMQLGRLVSHYNTFAPGQGYDEHQDDYDIGMVLLQGLAVITGQLGNRTVTAPALLYYVANKPHSMYNVGEDNIHLLVFEFKA